MRQSARRAAGRHRAPRNSATAGLAVGGLTVAAAMWGFATSGTKYALAGFAPLTLLTVQLVAAAAALWAVLVIRERRVGAGRGWRPRRWSARQWRLPLALGLLEPALAYVGETVGLARTSAANASVVLGLESTFVALLAAVFLRERISRNMAVALLAGLLGLVALEQVGGLSGPGLGDLLVLGGALSAAGYTIVARRAGEDIDALALTARQFTVAAGFVTPAAVCAWVGGHEPVPTRVAPAFWVAAALVGVVGFALSFLIYNWAIGVVEAGIAAVIINLIPAFGLLSAVAWLGEDLTGPRLLGASLITASVAIFTWVEVRGARAEAVVEPAGESAAIEADDLVPALAT